MYYDDDILEQPIINSGRWVKHTRKPHRCTMCSLYIPTGSPAYYSFQVYGGEQTGTQYGYQCPASTMNSLSCNYVQYEPCPRCYGTGGEPSNVCSTCHGTGMKEEHYP